MSGAVAATGALSSSGSGFVTLFLHMDFKGGRDSSIALLWCCRFGSGAGRRPVTTRANVSVTNSAELGSDETAAPHPHQASSVQYVTPIVHCLHMPAYTLTILIARCGTRAIHLHGRRPPPRTTGNLLDLHPLSATSPPALAPSAPPLLPHSHPLPPNVPSKLQILYPTLRHNLRNSDHFQQGLGPRGARLRSETKFVR
jgi:hypothetical protein